MIGDAARALAGLLLGLLVRVWLRTLRLRVDVSAALPDDRPWILAFFHGTQFPLLAWRRRKPTAVLVSLSRDGAIQARVLGRQGLRVARGSSSRSGAMGLRGIVRLVRGGGDAAFAVDGPRGPYGMVKEGALLTARLAGGVLVPMGSAAARAHVFARAWDRFVLPWPFSRVAVVLGPPLPAEASPEELAGAIVAANQAAHLLLTT